MATSREASSPQESAGRPTGEGGDGTLSVSPAPAGATGTGLASLPGGRVALLVAATFGVAMALMVP
ncbi:hypothetical protein, partial [Streptomyces sp.]|uniref:hypothetical protein n=1 Tax=Streptomyces sp. TaxID=1931 RepID=UPI002810DCE1